MNEEDILRRLSEIEFTLGLGDERREVADRVDELEARVENIEAPAAPVEDVDEPKLLDDGRFKIDAKDSDADFFETKIPDGTSVVGTSLAVKWTESGADGTKKTRVGYVSHDDLMSETGIDFFTMNCLDFTNAGSTTVVIDSHDWRGRIVEGVMIWDEEAVSSPYDKFETLEGVRIEAAATGHITLLASPAGQADSWEFWVDGDAVGVLKLTTVIDTQTTELTWKFTAFKVLGDCEDFTLVCTDYTDCISSEPTAIVVKTGSCPGLPACPEDGTFEFVQYGHATGGPSWLFRHWDVTLNQYIYLTIRCYLGSQLISIHNDTDGWNLTYEMWAKLGTTGIVCLDGELQGVAVLTGTDELGLNDCTGCTYTVTLT